jgi:hypothetical protein
LAGCDLSQLSYVELVRSKKRGAWPPLTKAVTDHRTLKSCRAPQWEFEPELKKESS